MLKLGGYLNILFAILHIVGLLWAEKMFEVVGTAEGNGKWLAFLTGCKYSWVY